MRWKLLLFTLLALHAAPRARGGVPQDLFYELGDPSSFTRGCFDPCDCPIFSVEDVGGGFSLSLVESNPLFSVYSVSDIDWSVPVDPPIRISGSGSYRVGGEVAVVQQLVLDLSVGGEPPQRFDSGLVPGSAGFPESLEIGISINGRVCFDTALDLSAKRVEREPSDFTRGDCNADTGMDLSDAVFGLLYLFAGGSRPSCEDACDSNDDGKLDVSDAISSLNYLFTGGAAPPPPFGACGSDPSLDPLGCIAFAPCVKRCEDEIAAIARETSIVGSSSGVVRLDYLTRRILGWQLFIGKYAQVTEPAARERAQADTGYGAGGQMLNPPGPEDAHVFYEPPGDFGGAAAVSARTGLTLFGGSIIWDGAGEITYPKTWRPAPTLGSGCTPILGNISARGYDLSGGGSLAAQDIEAALDIVRATALPEGLATSGYLFDAVVLLYPRSVGAFNPLTAEWIVILNGGWLE